jgi:glyoxylase-like metal-dependent hydrolase (beta-lactamase superfamily II)
MAIRILDCAPMSPWFPRWHIGGTCLLVDTDHGPVLVDTGLGLHDYSNPTPKVRFFRLDFGSHNDPENAAVRQVARLGCAPEGIRHIVMTHLHFDHAGGLPDFPHAQVHVLRREVEAMRRPRTWIDLAYDRSDFAHQPAWVLYEQPDAEWLGLEAIRLPFSPEMYLVPLFGHTRGHCGVAIQDDKGWLFHCADALPTNAQFDLTPQWLNRLVLGPHVPRLQAWATAHPEVRLLAGHMWRSFFEGERGRPKNLPDRTQPQRDHRMN